MKRDINNYNKTVSVLKSTPLFDGIHNETLEEILALCTLERLGKKSVISSSQTETAVFIILEGRAKLSSIHPETGREYIISLLEQGDAFDIISFLNGEKEAMLIEAIDNLLLLKAPMPTVLQWLEDHPDFNKKLFPYLGKRMRFIKNTSEDLALYDTSTRLARLILHYVDHNSERQAEGLIAIRTIADLPHEILAQMIGTARKVVNQNLQTLKKEGVITSVNGKLFVKDLPRLMERSKKDC